MKGQINGDNEVPKELVSIEGSYMNRVREDIFNMGLGYEIGPNGGMMKWTIGIWMWVATQLRGWIGGKEIA